VLGSNDKRPLGRTFAAGDAVGSDIGQIDGAPGASVRAKSKKASDVDRFLHPR
jgi:hypothetical protein